MIAGMRTRVAVVTVAAALALAGASTVAVQAALFRPDYQVQYTLVLPPDFEFPGGVTRIAILDLRGPYGAKVADQMVATIVESMQWAETLPWADDATPAKLEIIERSRLDAVLGEQDLAESGLVGDEDAARLGGLLGVQYILVGTTERVVDDTTSYKRETRSGEGNTSYTVDVPYHQRVARVNASVRVIEVATGRVVETYTKTGEERQVENQIANLRSPEIMLSEAAKKVGTDIVQPLLVRPQRWYTNLRYEKEWKEILQTAHSGDYDTAWARFEAVRAKDPYNEELLFNLAALYEAIGDYDKALEFFKAGTQVAPKEKDFANGVERMGRLMAHRDMLAARGYAQRPRRFEAAAAEAATADAAKREVEIARKGAPLYADADSSSATLASLPKGMRFEVLETKQSSGATYYRVRTFDGKEGWLSSKDASPR